MTYFSPLEFRMYVLIQSGIASMQELKECYTLDEALKLYALHEMSTDVQNGMFEDAADKN